MNNWTPQDWAMFFTALGTFVTAILAAVAAMFANLAKVRSEANAKNIYENTIVTKRGTEEATTNAKAAVSAASMAATRADELSRQMNGMLDDRISGIVKAYTDPLVKAFKEHSEQCDRHMKDIKQSLLETKKYR